MFNRLVEFEIGTTNIVPALAESWTVSPDGKVFTFKLRKGVKFHSNANFTPTRDFNADDVLFSWDRMANDKNPFHGGTGGQTYAYFDDMGMKNIVDKVEKVDPMTVRFTLKRPEAPFLADMAMDFASILSLEYFETMAKKGTPNAADIFPIGTGPFEFVSYQKDATIRYKAFDQHWARPAEGRQPGLLDHARRHGALRQAEDRRVPRHGVPEAGRLGRDEDATRTSTCCRRKASTSATSRSTSRRSRSTTSSCARR